MKYIFFLIGLLTMVGLSTASFWSDEASWAYEQADRAANPDTIYYGGNGPYRLSAIERAYFVEKFTLLGDLAMLEDRNETIAVCYQIAREVAA
jgi:hypothetical protein